jgi:hypothetical protein
MKITNTENLCPSTNQRNTKWSTSKVSLFAVIMLFLGIQTYAQNTPNSKNGNPKNTLVVIYNPGDYYTIGDVSFTSTANWRVAIDATTLAGSAPATAPNALGNTVTLHILDTHTATVASGNVNVGTVTGTNGAAIEVQSGGEIKITGGTLSIGSLSNATTDITLQPGSKLTITSVSANAFRLQANAVMNANAVAITGTGAFTTSAGSILMTSNSGGVAGTVQVTGTKTLVASTNYVLSGSSNMNTGFLTPFEARSLTITNTATVTLTENFSISGNTTPEALKLTSGVFDISGRTLDLSNNNTLISRTSGTIKTNSSTNLSFGSVVDAGNSFTIPNGLFETSPTPVPNGGTSPMVNINNLTVARTNTLTWNNQMLGINGLFTLNNTDAADVFNTNGNITLLSSITSQAAIKKTKGTLSGNITVQRYLNSNNRDVKGDGTLVGSSALGYRHMSAPVTGATFAGINGITVVANDDYNTAPAGGTSPGSIRPYPTVYSYDPAFTLDTDRMGFYGGANPLIAFDAGWKSPVNITDPMSQGVGYTMLTTGEKLISMTGVANDATTPIVLNLTIGDPASTLRFNFIGNPFPSPIDAKKLYELNRVGAGGFNSDVISGMMYAFVSTGAGLGRYITFDAVNGTTNDVDNSANAEFAVMQGFFVQLLAGDESIEMDNSIRSSSLNTYSYRKEESKNNTIQGLINLQLTAPNKQYDQTVVRFLDEATNNFDTKYDAIKFRMNEGEVPSLYSKDAKNTYSINSLTDLSSDVNVALAVNVTLAGEQSFSLQAKEGIANKATVYLFDKANNVMFDLSKGAYTFTAEKGLIADRFFLVTKAVAGITPSVANNVNVYPNPTSETLNVSVADDYKGEITLRLTDLSGREVWKQTATKDSKTYKTSVNMSERAQGMYILEVQGATKTVQKVVKQ